MRKRKSNIIPAGDFAKVQKEGEEEFEQEQESEFFANPLIPWWVKASHALSPPTRKATRTAKWCSLCGRKHSKREECEVLRLEGDLTSPPTKEDQDGDLIPNRKVGYYSTLPQDQ